MSISTLFFVKHSRKKISHRLHNHCDKCRHQGCQQALNLRPVTTSHSVAIIVTKTSAKRENLQREIVHFTPRDPVNQLGLSEVFSGIFAPHPPLLNKWMLMMKKAKKKKNSPFSFFNSQLEKVFFANEIMCAFEQSIFHRENAEWVIVG